MTPNPNPSPELQALRAIKAVTATAKDAVAGLSRIMAITRAAGVEQPYSELFNDADVRLIVERPRTEWAHLFKPGIDGCALPPEGWRCTRDRGHAGPCATVAAISPQTLPAPGEVERLRQALRNIAEGNLGDQPWQANYARIKEVAAEALATVAAANDEGVARITETAAMFVEHGFRCRTCDAVFVDTPSDVVNGGHPDNGCSFPNWEGLTDEGKAAAIRLLSQGGGK